jgi:hypothetical protein
MGVRNVRRFELPGALALLLASLITSGFLFLGPFGADEAPQPEPTIEATAEVHDWVIHESWRDVEADEASH